MSQALKKFYQVLELEPGASLGEVKEAYRLLSQIWHPDRYVPDSKPYELALRKQKELNNAYNELKKICVPATKESTLKQDAERGNMEAQFKLGRIYERGIDVAQDYSQAAHWYAQSAKLGYAPSQFNLGLLYTTGKGLASSYEQARVWWQLAAEQNHSGAQFNLGLLFEKGLGVDKDFDEALKWYELATASGDMDAAKRAEFIKTMPRKPVDHRSDDWWCSEERPVRSEAVRQKTKLDNSHVKVEVPTCKSEELAWYETEGPKERTGKLAEQPVKADDLWQSTKAGPESWYHTELRQRDLTGRTWVDQTPLQSCTEPIDNAVEDSIIDHALTVHWDKWRNDVLYEMLLKFGDHLNDPKKGGVKWSKKKSQYVSAFRIGTSAAFSCDITQDGKINNLQIIGSSGKPAFDQLVLNAIRDVEGSKILQFPKDSTRTVVNQVSSFQLGEKFDFKNYEFGDVEQTSASRKRTNREEADIDRTSQKNRANDYKPLR